MAPIDLTLIDNVAYIFNAEDYMRIRCEHRIIGKFVGCSVKWPRNTNLPGLPAIYSPYETQLLLDKGVVRLLRKDFLKDPSECCKEQYQSIRTAHVKEFTNIYCDKKVEESRKLIDTILAGKRKKIEKAGGNPNDVTEQVVFDEIRRKHNFDLNTMLVQVPTQDPFHIDVLDVKQASNVDPLKYRIFCDLWERNKWLTSGETFGGDFLVYPGEPLYFHASHIVHVMNTNNIPINTLITKGRLSIVVNKFCVFAYENPETREIVYQTFQWQGK